MHLTLYLFLVQSITQAHALQNQIIPRVDSNLIIYAPFAQRRVPNTHIPNKLVIAKNHSLMQDSVRARQTALIIDSESKNMT